MALTFVKSFKEGQCITETIRRRWEELKASKDYKSFDIIIGCPNSGDTILYIYSNVMPCLHGGFRSEEIIYPPLKSETGTTKKVTITGIAIIDGLSNGQGGQAKITRGGIGRDNVRIEYTSQFFRGYSVKVVIIGHYTDD